MEGYELQRVGLVEALLPVLARPAGNRSHKVMFYGSLKVNLPRNAPSGMFFFKILALDLVNMISQTHNGTPVKICRHFLLDQKNATDWIRRINRGVVPCPVPNVC